MILQEMTSQQEFSKLLHLLLLLGNPGKQLSRLRRKGCSGPSVQSIHLLD